jgi:hypothetical protein
VNLIVVENDKTGSSDWLLSNPASSQEIEGYASATSVNKGDSIKLFVNTNSAYFSLAVYRMGWYQGLGARKVFGPVTLPGTKQVIPDMDKETGLIDCAWVNPFKLHTVNEDDASAWISGIYLVKLTSSDTGKQSYITFVVRDDKRTADLLVQQNVTTYQAYNNWGGKSLYKWNSTDNKRASKVSFNRPYAGNQQNPAAAYGIGAGEFLCNVQPHNPDYPISNAGWEYNMIRWLEREGYDVAYCTNMDVHATPELLLKHKAWIAVGHDEYWSWEMRNHLEAALESGIHLGFFSANTGYWQVRFEASEINQQENRLMVCHKAEKRDPLSLSKDQRHLTTCQWRDEPVTRPEAQLLGVMYVADPVDGDIVISNAKHWVFSETGLENGSRLPGLLGYEVDFVNDCSPKNIEILAESPWTKLNDNNVQGVAHITIYEAESKALVFAAGTIQWSWALDDFNAPVLRASRSNPAAQQLTRNVLQRFISLDKPR